MWQWVSDAIRQFGTDGAMTYFTIIGFVWVDALVAIIMVSLFGLVSLGKAFAALR
jgi:hypothetical protein